MHHYEHPLLAVRPLLISISAAEKIDAWSLVRPSLRIRKIGIGGAVARSPLPHHRTCGSAYGGSEELNYPAAKWGRPRESK